MKRKISNTKKLAEASVLIAFATVLSMFKLVDMPYGGSVTAASMLPIAVASYRHGIGTGIVSGLVFASIQQLLGLNTLSYVTGWQSVLAVIILDYILAFTIVGLVGVFRGKTSAFSLSAEKRQSVELAVGTVFVCVLRYALHTVAGATVWAGLSIPTEAALAYSIGYNATYMIPETIVTALAAAWIGSVIDLSKDTPERFRPNGAKAAERCGTCEVLPRISTLSVILTVILDTVLLAPCMQNEESGEFDFSGISNAPVAAIIVISAVGLLLAVALRVAARVIDKKRAQDG